MITISGGSPDGFAGGIERTNPAQELVDAIASPSNPNWKPQFNNYDQPGANRFFADTLVLPKLQASQFFSRARLSTRLRLNGAEDFNDSFHIGHDGVANSTPRISYQVKTGMLEVLLIRGAGVSPAGAGATSSIQSASVLDQMQSAGKLHVYSQDDHSVDFLKLEACVANKDPQGYDIGVAKERKGESFLFTLTNHGQRLRRGMTVELTEIVPAGLVLTSLPNGWTCDKQAPVTGPDALKCTMTLQQDVQPGQQISVFRLMAKGQSACPNCVRVGLVSDRRPVPETDMRNNVGCEQSRPVPRRR